jgi:SprT protein
MMAKKEVPIQSLDDYLPNGAYPYVAEYLHEFGIHLTITKERATILGDYRPAYDHRAHRISVNGNLNPYAFLITLLHEMAHLLVFEQYGLKVQSHGAEWQQRYGQLLAVFIEKKLFPADIEKELLRTIRKPSASSCGEEELMRVLQQYDPSASGRVRVEELLPGQHFQTPDGRIFIKKEKLRKRHKAVELSGGMVYLFSGIYLVQKVIN